MADGRRLLESLTLTPNEAARHGLDINRDGRRRTAFELLAYPGIDLARLRPIWPEVGSIEPAIAAQLEVDARYASYVDRQEADVVAFRKEESVRIPADFAYAAVAGLSTEVRQKLEALRPATLAQAGRMEGMTPAALMLLLAHLRKAPARRTALSQPRIERWIVSRETIAAFNIGPREGLSLPRHASRHIKCRDALRQISADTRRDIHMSRPLDHHPRDL